MAEFEFGDSGLPTDEEDEDDTETIETDTEAETTAISDTRTAEEDDGVDSSDTMPERMDDSSLRQVAPQSKSDSESSQPPSQCSDISNQQQQQPNEPDPIPEQSVHHPAPMTPAPKPQSSDQSSVSDEQPATVEDSTGVDPPSPAKIRRSHSSLMSKSVDLSKFTKEDLFKLAQKTRKELKAAKSEKHRMIEEIEQLRQNNEFISSDSARIKEKYSMLQMKNDSFMAEITRLTDLVNELKDELNDKQDLRLLEQQVTELKKTNLLLNDDIQRKEQEFEQERSKFVLSKNDLELKTSKLEEMHNAAKAKLREAKNECDFLSKKVRVLSDQSDEQKSELSTLRDEMSAHIERMNELREENAGYKFNQERKIAAIEDFHAKKYATLLNSFRLMQRRLVHISDDSAPSSTTLPSSVSSSRMKGYGSESMRTSTRPKSTSVARSSGMRRSVDAVSEGSIGPASSSSAATRRRSGRTREPVNLSYLRNILVQFLMLAESFTDAQTVLIPVIGSLLRFTKKEKRLIDESYNGNRYFLEPNTLFPPTAAASK